ncbi:MAG: hypothetical protein ACYDCC_13565 [Actinomycetota bacterium]
MPWCPKEGTEYREGFTVCADCGATLVPNEPVQPPEPEEPEFVGGITLGSYDRIKLGLIVDVLQAHGISAVVEDSPSWSYTRTQHPRLGQLIVRLDQADDARRIIAKEVPLQVAEINARASIDPVFSEGTDDNDLSEGMDYFGWLEPAVAKVFMEACAQQGIACEPEYPVDDPPPPYAREDGRVMMHVEQGLADDARELLETRVRDMLPHRWIQFNEPLLAEDN